jgi:hypothetical protein
MFGNKVASLQKKSAGIVKQFTDMVVELTSVNDKIVLVKSANKEKISKLNDENTILDVQFSENTNLINKISGIFGK